MEKNDVFISYKRTDKEFVVRVDESLRVHGYEAWVDWEDIPPGVDDFRTEIESGILHATSCILVLSPEYLESEYCMAELNTAVKLGKRLIPIVFREVDPRKTPAEIAHINWIFFNKNDDYDTAFKKLIAALETDIKHVRTHTRLLSRATEWENNNFDNSFVLIGNELREAEKWLVEGDQKEPKPTVLHKSYVSASVRARSVRNRITWLFRVIAIAMVVAVIAGGLAIYQSIRAREEADRAEAEADRARSLELAASANSIIDTDPNLAIALALEATANFTPSPFEVRRSLARAAYSPGARRVFSGHTRAVTAVDYSPDGTLGVSASLDGKIYIWNLVTGASRLLVEADTSFNSVVFSPDGKYVLSGSDDAAAAVWDAETGRRLKSFEHEAAVLSVAYNPDRKTILTGTKGGRIFLWDIQSEQIVREFKGHVGDVFDLDFSLNGTYALSGSGQARNVGDDRTMRLWQVSDGSEILSIPHTGFVRSVCFIPGGRLAASASWSGDEEGGKIQIWSLADGTLDSILTGHTNVIDGIDCEGDFIASGSRDNTLRVWDVTRGLEILRFDHLEDTIRAVAFSPDGESLLTGFGRSASSFTNNSVSLWDLTSGAEIRRYDSHNIWIRSVAFSPDGQYILSASGGFTDVIDPIIRLWNTETGEIESYLEGHEAQVLSVAFSPIEWRALSSSQDGKIILWDLQSGIPITTFEAHDGLAINAVAYSPDGKFFVSGGSDKQVTVWDLNTGKPLRNLIGTEGQAHGDEVTSVAYSKDGKYILSTSGAFERSVDNTIKVWDAETGEWIRTFEGHLARVNQAAFTPDSQQIISVGVDQRILLWNIETGEVVRQYGERNDAVNSVAISPDGKYALTGSNDASITLWEIASGEQIRRFTGHTSWVQTVSFSPDGNVGLSGSKDTTVRTWQLTSSDDELIQWICENRAIRQFTQFERELYGIEAQTNPCP